jgi:large subunit ribosomal protein L24
MVTIQPRKSRKAMYDAPVHVRRATLAAHLSEDLLLKYNRRSTTVRKGDTVKILRGEFRGTTGKVLAVDTRAQRITVEGATVRTAKHAEKAKPIHPSNVVLTKLDLSDPLRRRKLGVKEEELTEEEKRKPVKEKKAPKKEAEEEEASEEEAPEAVEKGSPEEKE